MPSDTESRNPVKRLQRRASSKTRGTEISSPVLMFSNADSRDDLYTLQARKPYAGAPRPQTADGAKVKKRTHIADLLIDQAPRIPMTVSTSMHDEPPSPTSIGVALGSPTHCPWATTSYHRPSVESGVPPSFLASSVASTTQSFGATDNTKVQPKRNLFNSIFGRKSSSSTQNSFYKAQPQPQQQSQIQFTIVQQAESERNQDKGLTNPTVPTVPRWNSIVRRPSVGQMIRRPSTSSKQKVKKSATLPVDVPSIPKDIAPTPPPKDVMLQLPTTSISNQIPPTSSLLKVEIPDVTMERYSIMFGDVLKPRQSLLARRQSHLKGLQISDDSIPELSAITPEVLPVRRATAPSSGSPIISLFPIPPSSSTPPASQRAGLSRSNTLPSPNRQTFPERRQSKQKNGQPDNICSPSHGSETPISMHSDWPSDGSIDVSELSDEGGDDDTSEDIIIQLGDLAVPSFNPSVIPPKQPEGNIPMFSQPNLTKDYLRPQTEEVKHSPRTSSRARFASAKLVEVTQPVAQRKTSLPSAVRSIGGISNRQSTAPPASNPQQAMTKPMHRFNPLQSSPASPKEITLARELSLSRSRSTVVPVAKTARQPQLTTIVNPDSFPEPKGWRAPVPLHMRNKSEHVVLENA